MTDPRAKYQDALTAFATPGNRWGGNGKLTYWAAACGMTAEDVIADARAAGVPNRDGSSDSSIRRGMVTAAAKVQENTTRFGNRPSGGSVRRYVRTKPTTPKQPTDRVRRLIELGKEVATMEALRELSPAEIIPGTTEATRRIQAETHLQLLFGRADWVHIRRDKTDNAPAKPGVNLRLMRDWLSVTGGLGELVRPNPFTGNQGVTGEGNASFTCKGTIAAFRHMVFEFDEMPIADQCRFWAGFIRNGKLPLVSLTYSGGKSIHGVIRVDAPDAETWTRYRAAIIERYAADPDRRFRLDVQALNPLTGTRLAGAVRRDTGRVQELLYSPNEPGQSPPPDKPAPSFTRKCVDCPAITACKAAFGRFWTDKSSNGSGCIYPLDGEKLHPANM